MEQENTISAQSAPGTPLRQISADRINQINHSYQMRIPQSPSMPVLLHENIEPRSSDRRDSDVARAADVKAKIAFLNGLAHVQNGGTGANSFAIAGSPIRSPVRTTFGSPHKSHSRANSTISIPTDQSDLAQLVQSLHAQLEQSRNRERLVSERVESMMEQLTSAHSRARHEKQAYEKEIKSVNKMQYKSELALIRCQEELREARNEQEGFKVRAEHERQAKEKSRQEAFERARTLASNIEELEVVKRERDVLRTENDTLKAVQNSMDLTAHNHSRVVSREIGIQTHLEPPPQTASSCNCSSTESLEIEHANIESETVQELQEELQWIKSQLRREKDLVHFLNMQCQFRACACRQAEERGVRFVYDHVYDQHQQELAQSQGLKRKAEDELALPRYITLRESIEQKSRERKNEAFVEHRNSDTTPRSLSQAPRNAEPEFTGDAETFDYTPRATKNASYEDEMSAAGVIPLHEAAHIPLPSPRSDDLEPTAILEDMTQVMVEPELAATANHFAFSTSMSSRRPLDTETAMFRQSHSAVSVQSNEDLFDIGPPRNLPPRPSTVMGIRTTDSPIRMVPPSPHQAETYTPATSPPRYRSQQVPLKDSSPLRKSVTQPSRSGSNNRNRERTRARSPTPSHGLTDAHSPSSATYFPVTPKVKHERQPRQHFHIQSNSQLQALQSQSQTTTTLVPLRGLDEDDVFTPEKQTHAQHQYQEQHQSYTRGRQPLAEADANTHQNMLPGTPITREAALAQIRARRDRARSVNMRKQATAGKDEESGRVKTPKSVARRGVMLNRDGRDISNLSQASAPARF